MKSQNCMLVFTCTCKQKAAAFPRFGKKCMALENNEKHHLKFFSGLLEDLGTLYQSLNRN